MAECAYHSVVKQHIDDGVGFRDKVIACETEVLNLKSGQTKLFGYIDTMKADIADLPKKIYMPIIIGNAISITVAAGILMMVVKR